MAIAETQPTTPKLVGIGDLLQRSSEYLLPRECAWIKEAYVFAEKAHRGQKRHSGEDYIYHPINVAHILAGVRLDAPTLVTALLHDTVEDTAISLDDIETHFTKEVRDLVDGVTKLSKINFRQTHARQGENIRKMIVAMGKDVRVVLVKMADRLHNMRTLSSLSRERQLRVAQETLDIYAPLSERLGMCSLTVELEDLGFKYTVPHAYYALADKIKSTKSEREAYIVNVKKMLSQALDQQCDFQCEVSGRPKHLYSIFKKMESRQLDFEQIRDILAFRVNVEKIPQCYMVLGVLHALWQPVPGRFKDFIAMPKNNNYQSLHTTLVGPSGKQIEVQIRTHAMHIEAEWGVASHWKYKSADQQKIKLVDISRYRWLKDMVSQHQQVPSSDEFLENIKEDLTQSDIYVLTPKGDVKEFPLGATPVDFAFSIHTDIGVKLTAARVNGSIVPLSRKLQSGDTVEVITSPNQQPSRDWLNFVVTARAKSKIRSFIRLTRRKRAASLGLEMLRVSMPRLGVSMEKAFKGTGFEKFLKEQGCASKEELYVKVGFGLLAVKQVAEALGQPAISKSTLLQKAVRRWGFRKKRPADSLIQVDGLEDVLVHFAHCCNPIPGDSVVGYVLREKGVSIHRSNCAKAFNMDPDRMVDVDWRKNATGERVVKLQVLALDIKGLLQKMTEVFNSQGINIKNAQIRTTRDKKALCVFEVWIQNTQELNRTLALLERIKGVLRATRT